MTDELSEFCILPQFLRKHPKSLHNIGLVEIPLEYIFGVLKMGRGGFNHRGQMDNARLRLMR
jgi:hypothetical protein